jgi:hypothetical protein
MLGLTQFPLQVTWPAEQRQIPPMQDCPPPHACPHVPQLLLLRERSKQLPLQSVCPGGQAARQAPLTHTEPSAQTLLQVPQ